METLLHDDDAQVKMHAERQFELGCSTLSRTRNPTQWLVKNRDSAQVLSAGGLSDAVTTMT
jgi:hypothetical protein